MFNTNLHSISSYIILLLLFAAGFSQICIAQNDAKVDSLLNELQKVKYDTSKVNTLNSLSELRWQKSHYAESKKYAEDALLLAEKINFKKGIANSYNNIGLIYKFQGNHPEALEYFISALKILHELGDKKKVAETNMNIGEIYMAQGNNTEALKNYRSSLSIRTEIGDKQKFADSYFRIGYNYNSLGNYPEALKNHLAALKIYEELGDKKRIAISYQNIGLIYKMQENYSEALKYILAYCKIFEEIGDKGHMAHAYYTIGNIYWKLGNYSEALKYELASVKILEEMGSNGIIANYNSIGIIYTLTGNHQEALKYFLASVKLVEESGGTKWDLFWQYNNLGCLYIKMHNLVEANKYLNDALSISLDHKSRGELLEVYNSLAKLDSAMGNHQLALEHYKLYTLFKDSILNDKNSKMITEMQTKYETEKKDKEIQKLESEKQISSLQFTVQQESLRSIQSEKDKIQTENLFNLQQVELLDNEKKLQQLALEKNQVDLTIQKTETERKQDQLVLLNKEGVIQKLEIKKQTLLKNYFLGGLFLFGILAFFVYNNHITRQQLKLQTLRNKIASDLHDDVGSTLSSISIFTQMAQQSNEVTPLLNTIGESSRKMLDAMADIVWTINPENDQFEKIILRMRNFAFDLLGAKKIDFDFKVDEDISRIKLPMEVRKDLYLIFKEATNNMVKYADATRAVFSLKSDKDNLTMLIRDNGKGFDPDKATEGNGIKNMKKRALDIGAKLLIDSGTGNGTTIQLRIAV